jgi:ubiquinone/menaquinone biosynthesis C-methylase UbiE
VGQEATQNDVQAAIKLRRVDVYAGFLIPHLRAGATVLDCACGAGTITLGLAEAVPDGHVIGVDLDLSGLKGAQRAAVSLGQQNVSWIGADGRSLPFHGAIFDAVPPPR